MNSCNFTGRLTANPELRTTGNGVSVCSFTLAVKRPRVKDATDFINFVAWRQSAEYISSYGSKGAMVEASGSLTARQYEDKNGNKRTAFEVTVDNLSLLESRQNNENAQSQTTASPAQENGFTAQSDGFVDISPDDDLPF